MNLVPFLEGNTAVLGLQWGDEGKGKIVDLLTEKADVVVRYCGGANAGHSVKIGGEKYATHLLPVGVFRPNVLNIIANGVVLDPEVLFREIDDLAARGLPISPLNLKISYKTHVVMPWHKAEDAARESSSEGSAIGTTRRGIGPTYADKMQRATAIRVADLIHEENLREKIGRICNERNKVLKCLYDAPPLEWRGIFETYRDLGRRMAPFVDDVSHLVIEQYKQGKKIVFEGAHAVLLDIDHGTFPYVTSSSCSSLGLFSGAGVPPQTVRQFVGVMKAYTTRVGGGPFPTELDWATPGTVGYHLSTVGAEKGVTTGRFRRCGWFDAALLKRSAQVNGLSGLCITKLDVLDGIEELQLCTGYELDGEHIDILPLGADEISR